MSIRKRAWTTRSGQQKEAWVVDYLDGQGIRRLKAFARKKEADGFAATTTVEVREGTHVADSASMSARRPAGRAFPRQEGALPHTLDRGDGARPA